ncbi:MAG: prolipoprotein diacylglyceryl transferase [Planctomycetota bacterium]|jgi:phosphatidylglycerol:prolipoprotein diacylglycerol transferase|nr:prolipoprotein diacylglyceryl transferase [Planctomycetota bacterium]
MDGMQAAAPDPYWTHDLDPFLLQISGSFGIRWYGLAYLAGLVIGWWLLRRWSKREYLPLNEQGPGDAVMYLGLGMILGGRLGYCLFYRPELMITFTSKIPFWGLLAINEGGMASHGGIIGFFIGGWLFARKYKTSIWVLGDAIATAIPVGVMCGRIANFINGELWGRVTDVAWAVRFPAAPDLMPRHPSQLYAVVLEGLIPFVIGLWVYGRHRRPGLNVGLVMTLYAIGRFVGEFFRQPDEIFEESGKQMGTVLGPFSMGQVLTVPVFAFGVFMLIYAWKRGPKPELYTRQASDDTSDAVNKSTAKS